MSAVLHRSLFFVFLLSVLGSPTSELNDESNSDFFEAEYKRYLMEVVEAVNNDDKYQAFLKNSGSNQTVDQISQLFELASHNTRNKLDEMKRIELRRLKDWHRLQMSDSAAKRKEELSFGMIPDKNALPKLDDEHIDLSNPDKFTPEDFKKLISKITRRLTDIDRTRRKDFKAYQMNKELAFKKKLRDLPPIEQKKRLDEYKQRLLRSNTRVNHPGSHKQLAEVWEKVDMMDPTNFDPKVFFMLHDVDGDNLLSISEIEALFLNEIQKIANTTDVIERDEEMNRMREHVFLEVDEDKDGMISLPEFLRSSNSNDENWETFSRNEVYSDAELKDYEEELNKKPS